MMVCASVLNRSRPCDDPFRISSIPWWSLLAYFPVHPGHTLVLFYVLLVDVFGVVHSTPVCRRKK